MVNRKPSPSSSEAWPAADQRRNQDGFTLIELLVVIIILGILSAVVVFAVRGVGDKGQSAAFATDAKTVRTAEEAYCAKVGNYGSMDELVAKKFLSEPSTITQVTTGSGGPCGTGAASAFNLTTTAATVNIAANADQWPSSDTGSGAGYSSSAFVYPLNSNLNEPLLIMNSDYTIAGGLAASYERIPFGAARNTYTSPLNPAALPLPTHTYPGDRPFGVDTWRFHLRTGVTFHDGQPFDADDVIWTWRDRQGLSGSASDGENTLGYTMKIPSQISASNPVTPYDSVEKIDAFTVDFTPRVQNLRFPEQVLHPKGAIVEVLRDGAGAPVASPFGNIAGLSSPRSLGRHLDGSTGGVGNGTTPPTLPTIYGGGVATATTKVAGTPQGTGPFKYVSYSPTTPQGGGTASFLANPGYWGTNKAQVKGMNYTFIRDPAARTLGLQSGQFDMAIDLDPLAVATVQGSGRRVKSAPYGQNSLIYVNKVVKVSPASIPAGTAGPSTPASYTFNIGTDPAVRKASSLAIDRAGIVTAIFAGNAQPGRWMSPPGILGPYASTVPALSTNAALAQTTLDDDGWTCLNAGVPGTPGAHTTCAAGEFRKWNGDARFTAGRDLKLYMIGISLVPQTEYDQMADQMKAVGINLVTERADCDTLLPCAPSSSVGRSQMYASSMWDFDLELPNQNDANAAFLPVLRQACTNEGGNFRFAPADGKNGIGTSVNDTAANGNGSFPFGKTPCTSPSAVLGPIDTPTITPTGGWVAQSNAALTLDANQLAAANIMHILVNQDQSNVVIPVVGQYRIYGMSSKVNLGDPHPSQTSQRWVSLTMSY